MAITTDLLGLSSTEAQVIAGLGSGQALWRVAGRSFLVQHVLSDLEWGLVDTDAAMLEPDREALDRQAQRRPGGHAMTRGRRGGVAVAVGTAPGR